MLLKNNITVQQPGDFSEERRGEEKISFPPFSCSIFYLNSASFITQDHNTMSLSRDAWRAGLPGTVIFCSLALGCTAVASKDGDQRHWGCAFPPFFPNMNGFSSWLEPTAVFQLNKNQQNAGGLSFVTLRLPHQKIFIANVKHIA